MTNQNVIIENEHGDWIVKTYDTKADKIKNKIYIENNSFPCFVEKNFKKIHTPKVIKQNYKYKDLTDYNFAFLKKYIPGKKYLFNLDNNNLNFSIYYKNSFIKDDSSNILLKIKNLKIKLDADYINPNKFLMNIASTPYKDLNNEVILDKHSLIEFLMYLLDQEMYIFYLLQRKLFKDLLELSMDDEIVRSSFIAHLEEEIPKKLYDEFGITSNKNSKIIQVEFE